MFINYSSLSFALLTTVWSLAASPVQAANAQSSFSVATHTPKASQPASPNSKASPGNVVALQKSTGTSTSSGYTKALAQGNQAPEVEGTYGTTPLQAVESGMLP